MNDVTPEAAGQVPLALAFGAGLVASVNPCGFALLPSVLAYYLGAPDTGRRGLAGVTDGLVVGLVLTSGFVLVFGIVGALFAPGARAIVRVVPWVTVVMGVGLVALGAWLISGRHLSVPIPGFGACVIGEGPTNRSLFLFGTVYAVGSLSCTLPVFLLVVGAGLAAGSVIGAIGVFLAYALGMATVLMVLCAATAVVRGVLVRKVRRLFPHLNRISGGLLIAGGAYVAYYWTSLLRGSDQGPGVRVLQAVQQWAQILVLRADERLWLVVGSLLAATALLIAALRILRRERGSAAELADDADVAEFGEELPRAPTHRERP